MSQPKQFSMYLRVVNRRALFRAALRSARQNGMTVAEYCGLRRGSQAKGTDTDIIQLLDPGMSPPGLEIIESVCE